MTNSAAGGSPPAPLETSETLICSPYYGSLAGRRPRLSRHRELMHLHIEAFAKWDGCIVGSGTLRKVRGLFSLARLASDSSSKATPCDNDAIKATATEHYHSNTVSIPTGDARKAVWWDYYRDELL